MTDFGKRNAQEVAEKQEKQRKAAEAREVKKATIKMTTRKAKSVSKRSK
jgi:hypothetical protein